MMMMYGQGVNLQSTLLTLLAEAELHFMGYYVQYTMDRLIQQNK